MRRWILHAALVLLALAPAGRALGDPPVRDDLRAIDARIRRDPTDVGALVARSELFLRDGRPGEALADLRLAAAMSPGDPRIALQRAVVFEALDRPDEALAELEAYLEAARAPSADALALRARVLVQLDRPEDAVLEYDASLALRADVDLYLERGRILTALGRLEEAARGYAEGLVATGGAASLRVVAIELHLRIGRAELALRWIDEVLARAPARARWLLLRARALEALGREGEARAARDEALAEIDGRLRRRPTPALRVERGEALLALGRARDALGEAIRARAIAPRLGAAIELELRARRATEGGAR